MSPEYEGPQDEENESVAPRRVKHLIVLPGGAEPEDGGAGRDEASPDEAPSAGDPSPQSRDAPRQAWGSGTSTAAAVAPMAEALPLEVAPAQSLRLKLRVISRSVTSTRAPGMPFIIFASVLVGAAIFALVVLHVMVDQASFRMDSLEGQVTSQQAQLRELRYAVSVQEAPGHIASLATQAGLFPATQIQTLVGPTHGTPTATATASKPSQPTPALSPLPTKAAAPR